MFFFNSRRLVAAGDVGQQALNDAVDRVPGSDILIERSNASQMQPDDQTMQPYDQTMQRRTDNALVGSRKRRATFISIDTHVHPPVPSVPVEDRTVHWKSTGGVIARIVGRGLIPQAEIENAMDNLY